MIAEALNKRLLIGSPPIISGSGCLLSAIPAITGVGVSHASRVACVGLYRISKDSVELGFYTGAEPGSSRVGTIVELRCESA